MHDLIKDEPVMKETCCDHEAFARRLCDLSLHVVGTSDCACDDEEAHLNFLENHPGPTHNNKGEPMWEGPKAEKHLKADMKSGLHVTRTPAEF